MSSWLILIVTAAAANPLSVYWHNRAGVGALGSKDATGAYRSFTRALTDDPFNVAVQLNLGIAFEANEEFDKAARTYRGVLNRLPADAPERFFVTFNLANALAADKKIPAALKAYQDALEIKPNAIEVQTNIELLFAGGEGDGKGESKNESKDDKKKEKDDKDDPRDNQKKREDALKDPPEKKDGKDQKKPQPFESKDLKPEDVKRILDEIKNQEQSIRAEEYEKNPKDGARNGKDW